MLHSLPNLKVLEYEFPYTADANLFNTFLTTYLESNSISSLKEIVMIGNYHPEIESNGFDEVIWKKLEKVCHSKNIGFTVSDLSSGYQRSIKLMVGPDYFQVIGITRLMKFKKLSLKLTKCRSTVESKVENFLAH